MSFGLALRRIFSRSGHDWFIAALLTVHMLLLARIAVVNAPVVDEIAHVPAGLYHWHEGNFELYRVNPPLVRMIAALPLLLDRPRTDWKPISRNVYARSEFSIGQHFIDLNRESVVRFIALARCALIPISAFGAWICYRWACSLFGRSSGLIALILWCLSPDILAWGATVTSDLGAAALGIGATYAYWRWMRLPTWTNALIAGFALGLAELTKSIWSLAFLLWPALWIACRLLERFPRGNRVVVMQLATLLLFALYLLNLGYAFEGSFKRLDQFKFISSSLTGNRSQAGPANRFKDTWLGKLPVPLPANYVLGLDVQKHDLETAKWSYLRSEHKLGGWYHYYIYGLAVKMPLGLAVLFCASTISMITRRADRLPPTAELLLWIPPFAILVLVSSQTGFNRYIRYVLPLMPFIFILASRIGKDFVNRPRAVQLLCVVGLTSSAVESLWIYPHSMSYFNAFVGGPLGGPRHLLDANVDWGQDLLQLKRYASCHARTDRLAVAYFGVLEPAIVGLSSARVPCGPNVESPDNRPAGAIGPLPGWYAVSVNLIYGYRETGAPDSCYVYFRQMKPVAMAGYSIYIYRVTTPDANRIRRVLGLSEIPDDGLTGSEE
jgi:hypothetical protein